MIHLFLVRHAESTWNAAGRIQGWADPPLSPAGMEQAQRLAERLAAAHIPLSAIYASPLQRAWQTAQAIGQAFNLPVQPDDRLRENNVGQLTGLTEAEVAAQFAEWLTARRSSRDWLPPPGGETRHEFAQRVIAAMDEITARHAGQMIALVSHGGTLNVYLAHLLELPLQRALPFRFDNSALSIVTIGENRIRLLRLNDTAHLNGAALNLLPAV